MNWVELVMNFAQTWQPSPWPLKLNIKSKNLTISITEAGKLSRKSEYFTHISCLYSFRMHYLFNQNSSHIKLHLKFIPTSDKANISNRAALCVCMAWILALYSHTFRASPAECRLHHYWAHPGTVLGRESAEFDDMWNCNHLGLDPVGKKKK